MANGGTIFQDAVCFLRLSATVGLVLHAGISRGTGQRRRERAESEQKRGSGDNPEQRAAESGHAVF